MTLNPTRVGHLLRRRFHISARNALAVFGPALLILLFVWLVAAGNRFEEGEIFVNILYSLLFIGVGYFLTSGVISELSSPEGRQAYLTLPASNAEKWLCAWLYSGPIFVVTFTLGYWLVTSMLNVLFSIWYPPHVAFDPTHPEVLEFMLVYLTVINPVALIGAVAFNRWAFAKTAMVNIVLGFGFMLFTLFVVRIVFADHFEGLFSTVGNLNIQLDGPVALLTEAWPRYVALLALCAALLAVSYFKVQEKEV